MQLLLYIVFFFLFFYGLLFIMAALRWKSAKSFTGSAVPGVTASVLIAARNEEHTIYSCLQGIAAQQFPPDRLEVIVINDASTDGTAAQVSRFMQEHPRFPLRLLELKGNPWKKKGALLEGIHAAKGSLIITRDADTFTSSAQWLGTIVSFYSRYNPAMIICPVRMQQGRGFFSAFQLAEHLALQTAGAGMALAGFPFLCNGANLAFSKNCFTEAGGYEGNLQIASGDDIFLLEKFRKKYPGRVQYLKSEEAAAIISPARSLREFFFQKIRWAGKFRPGQNAVNTLLALLVAGLNFLLAVSAFLSLFFRESYKSLILCFLLKWFIDFLLLILASAAGKSYKWVPWFIFLELFNHVYSLLIPFSVFFVKPYWKGRKI